MIGRPRRVRLILLSLLVIALVGMLFVPLGTSMGDAESDTVGADMTTESEAVDHIELVPDADQSIEAGQGVSFEATAYDEEGNVLEDDDTEFDWDAEDGSIAVDGFFDETVAGTYNVTATFGETTSNVTTVTVDPGAIEDVVIDPTEHQTIEAGETIDFTATALDEYDNVVEDDDSTFDWDAEDGSIGDAGHFEETNASSYNVTATSGQITSEETTVLVETGAVDRVELFPTGDQSIEAGQGVSFEATAYDGHDNVVEADDTEFDWDAEDGSIAVDGFFDETNAGTYNVTGTFEDETSTATMVTVDPGDVEAVVLDPADEVEIAADRELEFAATALDSYDNVVEDDDTTFDWDAEGGTITDGGVFNESAVGAYNVTGTFVGVTSPATPVEVLETDVDRVDIVPADDQTITAGQGVLFEATAYDEDDSVLEDEDTEFDWEAEGGSVAGDGFFDETDGGTYNVTAKLEGVTSPETMVTVDPGAIEDVVIDPAEDQSIEAGDTIDFTAMALDQYDNVVEDDDSTFDWDAEDGSIGDAGHFEETNASSYNVTAASGQTTSEETTVLVETGAVDRVELFPTGDQSIEAGQGVSFEATAYDDHDNVVEDEDTEFNWEAEGGSIAVDGFFSETDAGTYDVTATYEDETSNATMVTVDPGAIEDVVIDPAEDQSIEVGDTIDFTAMALDQYDNVVEDDDSTFDWDAEDGSIGDAGHFEETNASSYNVTATSGQITSEETTVLVETGAVDRVELFPTGDQSIEAGQGVSFEATAYDDHDNVVEDEDTAFDWDAEGGSIAVDGFFDETSAGQYNVTATVDGVTGGPTMVTVESGEPANLGLNGIDSLEAGTISDGLTVAALDEYDNVVAVAEETTVTLSTTGTGTFYEDSGGTDSTTEVVISAGAATATVHYSDTTAGTHTLTADALDLAAGTHDMEIVPGTVEAVALDPAAEQVIEAGETIDIAATALDEYDNVVEDEDSAFSWDAGNGAISDVGLFKETDAGAYDVIASYEGLSSPATPVTVDPAEVETVSITPDASQVIEAGDVVDFEATAFDAFDNVVVEEDSAFTWEADGGTVSETGLFDETDAGEYDVIAIYEAVPSPATAVTVEAAEPAQLKLTGPASVSTETVSDALTGAVHDEYGNLVPVETDTTVSLSTTSANGTFYEDADGTTATTEMVLDAGTATLETYYADTDVGSPTLTVDAGELAPDSHQIEVEAPPEIETINLTVTDDVLTVGETTTVTVEAHYEDGSTADVTEDATIESNDTSVFSVTNTTVTAEGEGQDSLLASYENASDSVVLTVTDEHEPVPETYHGTLTINGSPAEPGTVVEALIDGEVRGTVTVETEGTYSSVDPYDEQLAVNGTEDEAGSPVDFRILPPDTADLLPGEANETSAFEPEATTELNLTANLEAPLPPVYEATLPNDGAVYTVGLPGPINGTLEDLFPDGIDGITTFWAYENGNWIQVHDRNHTFDELDVLVASTSGDGPADVAVEVPLEREAGTDNRTLTAGWNLVTAPTYAGAEEAFGGDIEGTRLVIDRYGQLSTAEHASLDPFSSYVIGATAWGEEAPVVSPFSGYFVYTSSETTVPVMASNISHKQEADDRLGLID